MRIDFLSIFLDNFRGPRKMFFCLKIMRSKSARNHGALWANLQTFKRGTLGFSVLRFWLFFRPVFRFLSQKTSVFRFWCSLRFADFSSFSIWFSLFVKNTSGFSVLVSDAGFVFSLFCPLWVPVSLRFEQQ